MTLCNNLIDYLRVWRFIACVISCFLPHDAQCTIGLVQSAVLRLHVICQSVCPSEKLVDQDHIGWKSWRLIARTISATLSSSLLSGEGKINMLENKSDTRRGRSRGGSFIPGNGKNFGERIPWYSHFLETDTVKQQHRCNIPHIDY